MGVTVEVDVKAAEVLLNLRNGTRRMAYAIANALHSSLLGAQTAVRTNVSSTFTLRRGAFVLREAAVIRGRAGGSGFPSATRLEGRFQTGDKERFLLGGFETGAVRYPFTPGAKSVAVPVTGGPARPSDAARVPQRFMFSNLQVAKETKRATETKPRKYRRRSLELTRHTTSGGKVQFKGASRTFLLTSTKKAPLGGVYQRVGPGRDDIRMVYSFMTPKRLPTILRYDITARQFVEARFTAFLRSEVEKTLNFQRGR